MSSWFRWFLARQNLELFTFGWAQTKSRSLNHFWFELDRRCCFRWIMQRQNQTFNFWLRPKPILVHFCQTKFGLGFPLQTKFGSLQTKRTKTRFTKSDRTAVSVFSSSFWCDVRWLHTLFSTKPKMVWRTKFGLGPNQKWNVWLSLISNFGGKPNLFHSLLETKNLVYCVIVTQNVVYAGWVLKLAATSAMDELAAKPEELFFLFWGVSEDESTRNH